MRIVYHTDVNRMVVARRPDRRSLCLKAKNWIGTRLLSVFIKLKGCVKHMQ
jgi:hypothetical protein